MINRPRRKLGDKYLTTRSGKVLKIHRSLGQRLAAFKEGKVVRKAERLRHLPKSRLKRAIWRLSPAQLKSYWWSRDGAIMALKVTGVGIVAIFVLTLGVFAFFRKDLPNITDISGSNLGGSISYYDRTGQQLLWQDYNAVKRVPVQGNDIAQPIKDATIATEDRNFYNEKGFDIKSILRAAFNDIFHRGSTQGGSTITQQLVKLTQDWTQQRSLTRKVKELILAVELERSYTKDQILTGYLNAAPYGGVDYGVQAAASDYFHKSAKDINLAESAMLAAIPKSPRYYSPYSPDFDKKAFTGRYNYVLDSMVDTGKIKKDQAEAAKKVDVLAEVQPQSTKYAGIRAPYFVLAAKAELSKRFLPSDSNSSAKVGGWKVTTTVDMTLQGKAEEIIQNNLRNVTAFGADEEALVLEDTKTGQMLALVGGTDFNNPDHGKINYAQWYISPGSSFKPYDYSALIENSNAGAGSVLYDTKSKLPEYPCTREGLPPPRGNSDCLYDYDFKLPGPLTLRYALAGSRNIPAVKAMLSAVPGRTTDSVNKTISTANSLMAAPGAYKCFTPGVDVNTATAKDETQCYEASAIGDGAYMHLDQHVNGLASLGRLGQAIPNTYIMQINDSANKAIYKWSQPKSTQVVRPDTAYIVDNMTSDPSASYLPIKWHRYNGWTNSIKTGTTNNGFDGLMMSWNSQFAVGSWVGYHTRNKTLSTFMENLTTPLTRSMMTFAEDNSHLKNGGGWTEPSGIQHLPAFVVTTHVGVASIEPSPSTDIYPSWYKPRGASGQPQTIDKVSGKIATDCTPPAAKQTLGGNAAPDTFSVDLFTGAGGAANAGSAATDDVHNCGDAKPSISTYTVTDLGGGQYQLSATAVAGTHPLTAGQFGGTTAYTIDGQPLAGCADGCSGAIDSNGNVTINFTNTSYNGNQNVVATVTDSVLYQTTSTWSGNLNPAGGGNNGGQGLTLTSAQVSGSKTNFSWSGGTGPYTVYKNDGTAIPGDCTNKNGNSCSVSKVLAPAGSQVYVQDSIGAKSSTVTVSGP